MEHRRRPSLARALSIALLTFLFGAPVGAQQAADSPPRPCEEDPRHRQLDFWLGEWRVVGSEDQVLGHSRITRRHGGCVIAEEWTSARPGVSGESLNYLDPVDGRWRQVWVGSGGLVITYEAELRDGAMRFQGRLQAPGGEVRLSRMTLEPIEGGRVRQRIEGSDDGGVTWKRDFEGTYLPAGAGEAPPAPPPPVRPPEPAPAPPSPEPGPAPAPAPAPAPEPAPTPPAPGRVEVVSVEVPDEALPPGERQQIRLQSPMVLELPVGPVEELPRGYSWSTAETAPYRVEGASIRRVTVARSEARGRVDVAVTVALHGERYLQRADLAVELLSGGQTLGRAEVPGFALGRSLPAQHPEEGLEKRVTLSLEREAFERAFSGSERPVLRLTLTVRD